MTHKRRYNSEPPVRNVHLPTCEHTGKLQHASRKAARRFAAANELGGLNAYECTACDFWHLGHLPAMIRDGDAVRWDIQPRRE